MNPIRRWLDDAKAPPSMRHVDTCDGLRALAVMVVAWFHIWQQSWLNPSFSLWGHYVDLQSVVRRGYMMVDLMLLLSGFLLYLPYIQRLRQGREALNVRRFYKKRLWRILPSYLFAVLFAFVYSYIKGGAFGGTEALWKDLLAHLTFTHTFSYRNYVWTSLNVALWTLAIEMQFYLIFPLVPNMTFLYLIWPIGWILSILTLLFVFFPTARKLAEPAAHPTLPANK